MNRLTTFFAFTCCLLIAGCGQETASVPPVIDHVAYARALTNGTYEIQLRYSITSSGGPCLSKDSFKTWTSYSTNWIYLDSIERTVNADQVIVTTDEGARELAIKDLKGTISFDSGTMNVQLEQPHVLPGGTVQGYAPYYLNGKYQIAK
jgi:hypothetical protein